MSDVDQRIARSNASGGESGTLTGLPSAARLPSMAFTASAHANRWSIVTIIAAMIVISCAILYESRGGSSATPVGLQASNAGPATAAPVAAVAPPEIVDIVSDQPLVGDGKNRELFVTLSVMRADVESVESRFVEGDALLRSRSGIIDVSHGPLDGARVPAGMIGVKTGRAVTATFEFVVTLVDGRRSRPFRKQIDVAPMPPTVPMITDIASPGSVVAGQPFGVNVAVVEGDARLAAIERTIDDGDVTGPSRTRTVQVGPQSGLDGDAVYVPIESQAAGRPLTIALTPVDVQSRRGLPKRVVVDVVARPLPVAPVPRSVTRASCTRSTCGSVVLVRELDGGSRETGTRTRSAGRGYEVLVRTDDRAIHAFHEPRLVRTGSRARVFDGKLLALYGSPAARAMRRDTRPGPDSEPFVGP